MHPSCSLQPCWLQPCTSSCPNVRVPQEGLTSGSLMWLHRRRYHLPEVIKLTRFTQAFTTYFGFSRGLLRREAELCAGRCREDGDIHCEHSMEEMSVHCLRCLGLLVEIQDLLVEIHNLLVCLLLAPGKGLWSFGRSPVPLQISRQSLTGEQVLPGSVCSYLPCAIRLHLMWEPFLSYKLICSGQQSVWWLEEGGEGGIPASTRSRHFSQPPQLSPAVSTCQSAANICISSFSS